MHIRERMSLAELWLCENFFFFLQKQSNAMVVMIKVARSIEIYGEDNYFFCHIHRHCLTCILDCLKLIMTIIDKKWLLSVQMAMRKWYYIEEGGILAWVPESNIEISNDNSDGKWLSFEYIILPAALSDAIKNVIWSDCNNKKL